MICRDVMVGAVGRAASTKPLQPPLEIIATVVYVKFVEAGGARVIPIIYSETEERLLEVRVSHIASRF